MNWFITISALLPGTFILHRGQKGVKCKRWHYPRHSLSRGCSSLSPSVPPAAASLSSGLQELWLLNFGTSQQWWGLLAEWSSFCPMPCRVDFRFPAGGRGGCLACLGALGASLSPLRAWGPAGGTCWLIPCCSDPVSSPPIDRNRMGKSEAVGSGRKCSHTQISP